MNINSEQFLTSLPAFFSRGKTKLVDMMVYARLYHPVLPYEHFILEYDPAHQVFMSFVIRKDDPEYRFFTARTMAEYLNSHHLSYIADDDFTPVRLVQLFPDYVVPQNEEDVFC